MLPHPWPQTVSHHGGGTCMLLFISCLSLCHSYPCCGQMLDNKQGFILDPGLRVASIMAGMASWDQL